jgi:hypothetical protein
MDVKKVLQSGCNGEVGRVIRCIAGPPVIAAVQGMATAGGCQLVASCDLVVASVAGEPTISHVYPACISHVYPTCIPIY